MKINLKKFIICVFVFIIIFQDSLTKISGLTLLNYLDEAFILLFFMIAMWRSKGKLPSLISKFFIAILLFWFVGVSSCIAFSQYELPSLIMASLLMTKFFILVVAVIIYRPSERQILKLIDAVKFVGAISLVTGLLNFFLPNMWTRIIPFTWIERRLGLPSVMGLFIHPGQYGWFMLFVAILYWGEYKIYGRRKNIAAFIIHTLAAILSLKAKVLIGVIAIIAADIYIIDRKRINGKKIAISVLCLLAIGAIFGNFLWETFAQYILGTTKILSARYVLLNRSIQIMRDYFPLGVGFGKFGSWYARINYSEYYYKYGCASIYGLKPDDPRFATDTFWPAVFGETGIIGTLVYIYMLYIIISNLLRIIRDKRNDIFQHYIALIGLLVVIQALAESLGEPIFNSSPQNILIGMFVGFGISMKYQMQISRRRI